MNKYPTLLSFRIDQGLCDRIEAARAEMTKRSAGVEVERARVVRLCIDKGLELVERELKIRK